MEGYGLRHWFKHNGLLLFLKDFFSLLGGGGEAEEEEEEEKESQGDSLMSLESALGPILWPQDHDLSWNQESDI